MMRLVPVKRDSIDHKAFARTKNMIILEDFINSGYPACIVEGYTHKSAESASASLRCSAERFGLKSIEVLNRNGKVYLIRTDMEGK